MDLRFLGLLLFQAALLTTGVMFIAWFIATKKQNATWVDLAWSGLFLPFSLMYGLLGDGSFSHRILVMVLVGLWSIRLTVYLAIRARNAPSDQPEDPRYRRLREQWGESADLRFLFFFQLQGWMALLLSVPFVLICLNPNPTLSPLEAIGVLVWMIGFLGEALADQQLYEFKSKNRESVLDRGLWKYSRHPNYFCEWLIWCGYFLLATGASYGWAMIYCPVFMYYILTQITGVPPAEEQASATRGKAYEIYQQQTNAFFPWFPKKI